MSNFPTLQSALHDACLFLTSSENPHLDAELLLSHTLKKPRSYLFAWPEYQLTAEQHQQFQQLLARRLKGEPIAYILGEKEFWSLALEVTPDTLIPRPDTELLVELVLQTLPTTTTQTIADLGTGSGAIALAVAKERSHWQVIATDKYPATLAVAKRNADQLALSNIRFYIGHWCDALPAIRANAIVSNPPYIAADDRHLADLSFEPKHALIADENGLRDLNDIVDHAQKYLVTGGWLFLEHGFEQALFVQARMLQAGYKNISICRDLNGHPRVTMGQFL
jgi:release factor glutamine methyltransferase